MNNRAAYQNGYNVGYTQTERSNPYNYKTQQALWKKWIHGNADGCKDRILNIPAVHTQ